MHIDSNVFLSALTRFLTSEILDISYRAQSTTPGRLLRPLEMGRLRVGFVLFQKAGLTMFEVGKVLESATWRPSKTRAKIYMWTARNLTSRPCFQSYYIIFIRFEVQ